MTFSETQDMDLVREILTDKRVYGRMRNDEAPAPELFDPKPSSDIRYVVAMDGQKPAALFLLLGEEVHFCFVPEYWGRTRRISCGFLRWAWEQGYKRLRGPVPSYNRLALRLAQDVGFRIYDLMLGGATKNGKPFDLILTEIVRPENAA